MEFSLNNLTWEIREVCRSTLEDKYMDTHSAKPEYVFGLCSYPEHTIYLNKDLYLSEKERTLKHELVHAWLWSVGATYENYSEEEVCNKCAAMCEFIYSKSKEFMDYKYKPVKVNLVEFEVENER